MNGFWAGRRVLITGHMGFKGAWLTYLLSKLGAHTIGVGRDDRPDPLLYRRLSMERHENIQLDINDVERLRALMANCGADTVFHLAAQSLVIDSYDNPCATFMANIMGTASVLEALRACSSVQVAVMVTSDKVYANQEWSWPYRESDALGGRDPYSASKAAAEIVIDAMRASFFGGQNRARIMSVRAGNVIGGGDWASHRLLPDAARAYSTGHTLVVRNPKSTRPWQHVLEPLSGYLLLAQQAVDGTAMDGIGAWNFGPDIADALPVEQVVDHFTAVWGNGAEWTVRDGGDVQLHEAGLLSVDSSRARRLLGWAPRWQVRESVERTARWYRDFYAGEPAASLMDRDIEAFGG